MLISLCAREFDFEGAVQLDVVSPDLGDMKRRGNRIATLDGGAAINDFGYSPADRTFTFRWQVSISQDEKIRRLIELHQRLSVAVREGVFECVVGAYSVSGGSASLQLLPVAKLSE